ncbi:phosphoribosylaminoimidazolesuccinocarboxamide synthase [Canibacter zhuwentaonis]|uniref:phosphoribosylaminoimidazolesuccinocarboxamide synthase n=1 Tax=Canibacter zhuwentaonis TaxID=2837491 RepID=UPI00350F4158
MSITNIPPQIPGWQHIASGKVREIYQSAAGGAHLLLLASDRVSAFDRLLDPPIPGKGALLTQLSSWWMSQLKTPNHLTGATPPAAHSKNAVIVKKLEMLPVECIVRGAITGSGYQEYLSRGAVCGIKLPALLEDGALLPEPIYTPAYKAPQGEHDENISYEQTVELVGADAAAQLRDTSLEIFTHAQRVAAAAGLILADTKFEFGFDRNTGELTLADEVLTSDSSRYWDAAAYNTGEGAARLVSFDKQIVRNWLLTNWDRTGAAPTLPDAIVERTLQQYRTLFSRLTGETAPA